MTAFEATIDEIAAITGGRLTNAEVGPRRVRGVATDTRQLPPPGFAFVALTGPNFDGNEFAAAAMAGRAAVVLVDNAAALPQGAPAIVVDDGLAALQRLAGAWRARFTGRVVGITGSNGKTTVKEMLTAILAPHRRVFRSPRSFNSQVGVALSLLDLPLDAEIALIECGVSRPGEMTALAAMVRPNMGILTHIGTAHLAGFGSSQRIAAEKGRLFTGVEGLLVVHESAAEYFGGWPSGAGRLSVGAGPAADVRVEAIQSVSAGNRVTLSWTQPFPGTLSVTLSSYAVHDAHNAACAAAAALSIGLDGDAIREGLEAYQPVPMRIEVHTTPAGITLINDSYSSDPSSVRSALNTLDRLGNGRRRVAVLGAMRDLGSASVERHREVGRRVARAAIDRVLAVGEQTRPLVDAALVAGLPAERIQWVHDADECARRLDDLLLPGDVVLVKASRPLHLEDTAQHLLETVSPTRLYIDLGAVAENVRRVRSYVGRDVALFAVVKSFGYGSDVVRVSELLEQQGADYLCVAYPDEGALLRRRGIRLPILVTNVLPAEADKIARYRLSAMVSTDELAAALEAAAQQRGQPIPIHLKVDTGMGRAGVPPDRLLPLVDRLSRRRGLVLEGLMSHLAAADDPDQDDFTTGQIAAFRGCVDDALQAGFRPRYVHIANSAGLLRFPDAHFTAVRLGLGLYGCLDPLPGAADAPELSPAISLHSRLIGVRELAAGHSVGYGRTYETHAPTRIGLVALGYNDGLPWSLSNCGALTVRGRRASIVGRVCMDATMIDLTAIPEAVVGDDVTIFGSGEGGEATVPELARLAGTIPYEILVRISGRVRRIVRLPT